MIKFESITSYEQLFKIYKTNGKTVNFAISKELYDQLPKKGYEDMPVIVGYTEDSNLYAIVKKVYRYPRTPFNKPPYTYGLTVELLIDVKIEAVIPVSYDGGDTYEWTE